MDDDELAGIIERSKANLAAHDCHEMRDQIADTASGCPPMAEWRFAFAHDLDMVRRIEEAFERWGDDNG